MSEESLHAIILKHLNAAPGGEDNEAHTCLRLLVQTIKNDELVAKLMTPEFLARCERATRGSV